MSEREVYTLKNRPVKSTPQEYERWIKDFEKQLRDFFIPVNMGRWLRENADIKTICELLERFIRKEVLGDVEEVADKEK